MAPSSTREREKTHTWYVGAQNDALYIIDEKPRPAGDPIINPKGPDPIAKVYREEFAPLLAAAPDLLAALTAMLEVQGKRRHPLGQPDEGIAYEAADAAAKARAAIAKAGA